MIYTVTDSPIEDPQVDIFAAFQCYVFEVTDGGASLSSGTSLSICLRNCHNNKEIKVLLKNFKMRANTYVIPLYVKFVL